MNPNQFTSDELKNLGILIQKAPITGAESVPVAMLLQKISKLLETPVETKASESSKHK